MKKHLFTVLKIIKWTVIVLVALIVLFLAVVYTGKGIRRITPKGGINETQYVEVNGQEMWISIYGKDINNPVLLYLHGGPGYSSSYADYAILNKLADDYTIVNWDQRSCGRTWLKNKDDDTEITLDAEANVKNATEVDLPFPHNSSKLRYNAATRTYDYYEYGKPHVDAGDGDKVTAFKNVFIQNAELTQFDDNGYMMFTTVAQGRDGWYITNGKAIPVTWSKLDDLNPTLFFDPDGNEVKTNTGKTYISIVRSERFDDIVIE